MSELFELEMDLEKNQYETEAPVALGGEEQQQQEVDEAIAKLQELARRQEELARTAVAEGWSVRQVELAVRAEAAPDGDAGDDDGNDADQGNGRGSLDGAGLTPATKLRPPGLLELENLLAEHLETRVTVQMGTKRGRVTVEFADLEDLERLYRRMAG